jgi:hypothetical protein
MNVQLAVLADAANIAPVGKLNVLGIFDTITATTFPSTHPAMALAIRLRIDFEDGEREHGLVVELCDEDGKVYLKGQATVKLPRIPPGEFAHINQILNFSQATFTKPGQYHFRLLWDGEEKTRVDVKLVQTTEGAPPAT